MKEGLFQLSFSFDSTKTKNKSKQLENKEILIIGLLYMPCSVYSFLYTPDNQPRSSTIQLQLDPPISNINQENAARACP